MEAEMAKYPKRTDQVFQYGTSGFRDKAEKLDYLVFRMGLLASLRSRVKGSAAIGLMITASHNPEPDNGVKLIDPLGEMLEQSWEPLATQLVNVSDEKLEEELRQIAKSTGADMSKPSLVFVGQDTRPSSSRLADAAIAGAKAYNGQVVDQGIVSTPLLHYLVNTYNTSSSKVLPSKESYYVKLSSAFNGLLKEGGLKKNYDKELQFDGSNGIGALVMKKLTPLLQDNLKVNVHNDDVKSAGKLNYKCGSDYVMSNQLPPEGFSIQPDKKIASVDGDADRIVYSFIDSKGSFYLLDGDRIAVLVAEYLLELLKNSGLDLELGLVQTAYSNGNCTKYINEKLKIPVSCVSTGVKHLHHKATEYDIGVYFEANGHGTVIFSNNAQNLITQAINDEKLDETKRNWVLKLKHTTDVINSIVGDAVSDMLLVETILYTKDWSIKDWASAYTNLPSKLVKVFVKDRNVIKTTDAERKCTHPVGLQEEIDSIVSEYQFGRSFVRPSGTEDVVRVYAEAATQEMVDQLASRVAQAVSSLACGVEPMNSKI
ncbi:phosphoacetylglucosamine mutase [Cimex lectularius]|uniref:Phosphoacetylglucosamine mutase n=1 Tax=Cimex lectularius TaxID=79782 RepID=A0A8I6RAU2_CIMLE|nr:phosphoacetylglucosamine mutase [Cimex lectularius]